MSQDQSISSLGATTVGPVRTLKRSDSSDVSIKQAKPSEIPLSPEIAKVVAKFHDKSMKRMATINMRDVPKTNLFHYTNEKAFCSIIDSGTFWFTSIYHMDDKEELTFGFNVGRSLVQTRAESGDQPTQLFCQELMREEDLTKLKKLFEFYSISFGLRDDPQQWKSYADQGRGIAMGLAPAFFELVPFEDPANPKPEEYIFLGKVLYGDQPVRTRHARVINSAIDTIGHAMRSGAIKDGHDAQLFYQHIAAEMLVEILWNCVTTKDKSWSHQSETRLLALNNLREPHLTIHNAEQRPRVELPQPRLKTNLVEVMVGPKADAAVEARVRVFLDAHRLAYVPIIRSSAAT